MIIEAGTFQMGTPAGELGMGNDEDPHEVTLSRRFAMLPTEVSQGRFESLMAYNPSRFVDCGPDCPVEMVNWHEAVAYCNALSASEGLEACYSCTGTGVDVICEPDAAFASPYDCLGYRLPTEAEWEYAARAGSITATYNGDLGASQLNCEQPNDVMDPIAWFCGNSAGSTHEVGSKMPNAWGVHDMLGHLWEWCHDWYAVDYPTTPVTDPWVGTGGPDRVTRGSSWVHEAMYARAGNRRWRGPTERFDFLGFRPVRSLP